MSAQDGIRLVDPPHPGALLRDEVLPGYGLSVTDAARLLGVTRAALSALLNGRAQLSWQMAVRVEQVFGLSMETLMRMQNSFDIAQARRRSGEIRLNRFVPPMPLPACPAA
jgi:antitoxin HigA-1